MIRCIVCGQEKTDGRFYGWKAKQVCKSCHTKQLKAEKQNVRAKLMVKHARRPVVEKECSACGQVFPVAKFYRNKHGGTKSECKQCFKEHMLQYRDKYKQFAPIVRKNKDRQIKGLTAKELSHWYGQQRQVCHYCGTALNRIRGSMRGATIDQLNPDKGYIEGNLTLACRRCNLIKGYWFTQKEMQEIARTYKLNDKW